MTTKQQVDLKTYKKESRCLELSMENELVIGGDLYPILLAVTQDDRLRFDIRERRFNVYYRGGSLLCVDGRKLPPVLHFDKNYFDEKYFKINAPKLPNLPKQFKKSDDIKAWVQAFPDLMKGMDAWWNRTSMSGKTREHERAHCQAMAAANSMRAGMPSSGYLVLDLEYQWAQRRFDMIAAKRKPTSEDPIGWVEPDLVFVEVKSGYGAVSGKSGLGGHACDYRDIIKTPEGRGVQSIKSEFQKMITQKKNLGLLNESLLFKHFSRAVPELLIVLIELDPKDHRLLKPLMEVKAVSDKLGNTARINFMTLFPPNYMMTSELAVSIDKLIPSK